MQVALHDARDHEAARAALERAVSEMAKNPPTKHLVEKAEAILPHMIMLRRMLLTAWIASHAETETAAWAGLDAFTQGTVALARAYLAEQPA